MSPFKPFIVACLTMVGIVATAASQGGQTSRFNVWRLAIEHHKPGEKDALLVAVAHWSRSDLYAALADLTDKNWLIEPQTRARLTRGAILLHTDILVLLRTEEGYDLPAESPSVNVVADGVTLGVKGTPGAVGIHPDTPDGVASGSLEGQPRAPVVPRDVSVPGVLDGLVGVDKPVQSSGQNIRPGSRAGAARRFNARGVRITGRAGTARGPGRG